MDMEKVDASYDLVVVGSGPAGQVAAELAASFGRRALIVEQNRPGGVVTTTGGAPTKALREAALYLTGYRQEEVYGVRAAAPLEVVLPTLRARVEWVRDVLQDVVADRLAGRGITYLQGTARLGMDRTVHVTSQDGVERRVAARAILLATGSRPAHPPGVPFDDPDVYDSDRIYSIRTAPKHIVIVGGGAVGVEFASAFTALGAATTLVSLSDRLLPTLDGELAGLLADEFEQRGVRVVLGAGAERVGRVDGRLCVTLSTGDVLAADAVLFAAGRTPNTAGLGLEEAGVRLDGRGRIVVDHYYRTSAAGCTPPVTWSARGSPRTRCSRGGPRPRTPADWCSGWWSIRSPALPSTAYPRSPAWGPPRRRFPPLACPTSWGAATWAAPRAEPSPVTAAC